MSRLARLIDRTERNANLRLMTSKELDACFDNPEYDVTMEYRDNNMSCKSIIELSSRAIVGFVVTRIGECKPSVGFIQKGKEVKCRNTDDGPNPSSPDRA